jgi:hypothetical protein
VLGFSPHCPSYHHFLTNSHHFSGMVFYSDTSSGIDKKCIAYFSRETLNMLNPLFLTGQQIRFNLFTDKPDVMKQLYVMKQLSG